MFDRIKRSDLARHLYQIGLIRMVMLASAIALLLHIVNTARLNVTGASTRYYDPVIATAQRGPDGRDYVYIGEEFYVNIWIVRHRENGDCAFVVNRYAEVVGGPRHGRKYLISFATLYFRGEDELRRTRWPISDDAYHIGLAYEEIEAGQVPRIGTPTDEALRRKRMHLGIPLLPDGIDEREFTFYVVGRYFCNELDYIIPRYIQGGDRPNISPRVNAILRRHRP